MARALVLLVVVEALVALVQLNLDKLAELVVVQPELLLAVAAVAVKAEQVAQSGEPALRR